MQGAREKLEFVAQRLERVPHQRQGAYAISQFPQRKLTGPPEISPGTATSQLHLLSEPGKRDAT